MVKEFINSYGLEIIMTILTAIAGFIGTQIKKVYEEKVNTEIKKKCAEQVVKAVEQMYSELHGDEKYLKAEDNLVSMLNDKGILITDLECEMLIESVVSEFNKSWEHTTTTTTESEVEADG